MLIFFRVFNVKITQKKKNNIKHSFCNKAWQQSIKRFSYSAARLLKSENKVLRMESASFVLFITRSEIETATQTFQY